MPFAEENYGTSSRPRCWNRISRRVEVGPPRTPPCHVPTRCSNSLSRRLEGLLQETDVPGKLTGRTGRGAVAGAVACRAARPIWHRQLRRWVLLCILAGTPCVAPPCLADVVLLRSASLPSGRQRVEGTIEDYTGRELVMVNAGGKRLRFKSQQVLRIEANWTTEHLEGNEHLARRQYAQAVSSFQAAARRETRPWVQRLIVARLVEAYRELGQDAQAAKLFLELVESDPDTPWFDVAPLVWLGGSVSPQLEERARQWLQDESRPAAVLLAASHLLHTARHEQALGRLETLADAADARYRALARGQLWRAALQQASPEQLERWSLEAEAFPACALPGVAIVLARGHAARKNYLAAALWGLRGAVLFPEHALLAAEGLWQAGTALEKAGHGPLAARVLAELAARYPDSRLARLALERLQALDPALAAAPEAVLATVGATGRSTAPGTADDDMSAVLDTMAVPPGSEPAVQHLAAHDEPLSRFLALSEALRARRLHLVTAWYAEWLAARLPEDDPRHIELACEQSRCLIDQAIELPPPEAAPLWQQAAAVVRDVAARCPEHPRLVLAKVQQGLVELIQGELGREALLATGADEAGEDVRARLREAILLLQAADDHVQKLLRSQPPRPQETALSTRELLALSHHISFQLARAYRNQGLAYPPDSADRINALRQAQERLGPLAQLEPQHALAWPARLEEIRCLRLLGELDQAAGRLSLLKKADPPPHVQDAMQAEELRLALASGKVPRAVSLADNMAQAGGRTSADLALALLEVWLAAWREAASLSDQPETPAGDAHPPAPLGSQEELRQRAATLVQAMAQYGPYWLRRAEALLATSAGTLAASGDVELVRRAAAGLFRKGQLEQALQALAQAQHAAAAAGNPPAAFEAAFLAAAMLESSGRGAEAATQYRAAALADPQHPRAAEAHLQAVYLAAHPPADSPDPATCQAWLEEHLRTWPDAATAMQARLWLGRLLELQGDYQQAAAAYEQVPLDDRLGREALAGAVRAYDLLLSQAAQAGKDANSLAAEAGRRFARLVELAHGSLPAEWSPAQRDAVLAAARVWLLYTTDHYGQAERLLAAGLSGMPPPSAEWRAAAQGWLVFALAAQGQRAKAQELVGELAGGTPSELVALLQAVDGLLAASEGDVRRELALLQLALFDEMHGRLEQLADQEQAALALCLLRARLAAEDIQGARAQAERIVAAHPERGRVQEACAQLLTDSMQPELLQLAARRWQEIVRRLPNGSARWLHANYYLALTWERLGQKKKAAALARYVQQLYPEGGTAQLRAQFAALLKRCQ